MQATDKWDIRFLRLAKEISSYSKDPSTQVGAVIVQGKNRIVSTGYNGFPPDLEDKPELLNNREEKYARVIHAEHNALMFSGRKRLSGCTLYTYPFSCCSRCASMFISMKIKRCVSYDVTPELKERWGVDLDRARSMFEEAGVQLDIFDQPPKPEGIKFLSYKDLGMGGGCIATVICPKCNIKMVCDSGAALDNPKKNIDKGIYYISGTCCCTRCSCDSCGHKWGWAAQKC